MKRVCARVGSWRWQGAFTGAEYPTIVRPPRNLLAGQQYRYKIKLRSVGVRLVYEVRDAVLLVIVVAVCKRERNAVTRVAAHRRRRSAFEDPASVVS